MSLRRGSGDNTKSRGMVVLPVNERALVQLESALELHRHQQEPKSDRIAFSDFCKIASKVDASADITAADGEGDKTNEGPETAQSTSTEVGDDSLELWKLSNEERFWHDLYCVAVPILYRETDTPETTESGSSSRRKIAMASLTLRMCEAEESSSNNRMKKLRKLVQEARSDGVPRERSDRAVRFLFALRNEQQIAAAEKKSPRKEKNHSAKQFRADFFLSQTEDAADDSATTARPSTIEDRIRARAKERQDNLAQAKAARKDPREERVAIADALYSYACRILRKKRSRLGGGDQKQKQTKCVAVTFKEVVQSGLASNRSRNDVMRLFSDIVQVLSRGRETTSSTVFLKWKDPKTGERNGVPIPKTATVWIDSTDFKKVREILDTVQLPESSATGDTKKRPSSTEEIQQRKKAL